MIDRLLCTWSSGSPIKNVLKLSVSPDSPVSKSINEQPDHDPFSCYALLMAVIFLQKRQTPLCAQLATFFSTWYSQPVFSVDEQDPVLSNISRAIIDTPHVPLDSSLKKFLPSLTPYHVSSLIIRNPYSLSPASIFSFFKWVSSQDGFRLTLRTYCTMACFLCSHHMLSEAQSLLQFVVSRKGKDSAPSVFAAILEAKRSQQPNLIFNALMDAYTDSGFISDAIQCFRLVRKHGDRIPYNSCSHLLDRMMKINSPSAAWAFFSEILKCGFPPNVYTFNILMHSFCKEGKLKEARVIFDEIGRQRLEPTVVSFNTLINGYCKTGNLDAGFDLKQKMLEKGVAPDVFTYSVLVHGLCKECRLKEAGEMFEEMCNRGLVPNGVIFTTLIDGHCKKGQVNVAVDIYESMLRKGVKPDLIAYNALINGFCKSGDLKEARRIVNKMQNEGLKPDKITYTTLLDAFCKEGDVIAAIDIRNDMVNLGIRLDDVAYTALIFGLAREGQVVEAERTMREMIRDGLQPEDATYTMIIDGYCRKADIKKGFDLLKEMRSSGRFPSVVTYNALMNGLCKHGQMKNANMLLDAMLNIGVRPDDVTYNILLEGHCKNREKVDLEKLRSEKGMVSDFAAYTSLINELTKKAKK